MNTAVVLQLIYVACAAVVAVRVICVGFKVRRCGWSPLRFAAFSVGCVLKMAGALLVAGGAPIGAGVLLIGAALAMADRRNGVEQ